MEEEEEEEEAIDAKAKLSSCSVCENGVLRTSIAEMFRMGDLVSK